uniref:Uncharacterized protein n=1 Tax=Megaselia scalaris TaxID=36166 RepID=T1GSK5_MEGSC
MMGYSQSSANVIEISKSLENSLLEDSEAAMDIDTEVDKEGSNVKAMDAAPKQGTDQEKTLTYSKCIY